MRNALIALGVVVLIAAAFWGGTFYANAGANDAVAGEFTPGEMPAGGQMPGGPNADLTEEQIAEMEGMTQEERMTYMQEELGVELPAGGAAGAPGGMRGGQLKGTVIDATGETLTVEIENGSQTVYLDEDTVVAYAEGAAQLSTGSEIIVLAEPAADGVTLASVVVVQ